MTAVFAALAALLWLAGLALLLAGASYAHFKVRIGHRPGREQWHSRTWQITLSLGLGLIGLGLLAANRQPMSILIGLALIILATASLLGSRQPTAPR